MTVFPNMDIFGVADAFSAEPEAEFSKERVLVTILGIVDGDLASKGFVFCNVEVLKLSVGVDVDAGRVICMDDEGDFCSSGTGCVKAAGLEIIGVMAFIVNAETLLFVGAVNVKEAVGHCSTGFVDGTISGIFSIVFGESTTSTGAQPKVNPAGCFSSNGFIDLGD